ncbi:MAG TPA: hypothetical protein VFV58_34795 [Blastocatellia bacterium]|jgi:hypothetical protein|nr:hypothetical protein [Blastocatellia bacterium]
MSRIPNRDKQYAAQRSTLPPEPPVWKSDYEKPGRLLPPIEKTPGHQEWTISGRRYLIPDPAPDSERAPRLEDDVKTGLDYKRDTRPPVIKREGWDI